MELSESYIKKSLYFMVYFSMLYIVKIVTAMIDNA